MRTFDAAVGLITTTHIDQLGFPAWSGAVQAMLSVAGGGSSTAISCARPGLRIYVPIVRAKRADLVLTRLRAHPIFEGIEQSSFEENKGVAGFYGRGHNPLPEGAVAINGVSAQNLPIDWESSLPGGGRMFVHAGNDIGGMGGPNKTHEVVAPRILSWTLGDLG